MATNTAQQTRTPLTKERVLEAAVELADREGIGALTMRNLAHEVGVGAMSLYYEFMTAGDDRGVSRVI